MLLYLIFPSLVSSDFAWLFRFDGFVVFACAGHALQLNHMALLPGIRGGIDNGGWNFRATFPDLFRIH